MNNKILFLYKLITLFLPETRMFHLKRTILRQAGAIIGENVRICSSASIIGDGCLTIGDNSWIGPKCLIVSSYPSSISIASNVDIAPNTTISNGSHEIGESSQRAGAGVTDDIIIETGVWIGMNTSILIGVCVGKGTVVGASSNVISDLPSDRLCVGNPCKVIKLLN